MDLYFLFYDIIIFESLFVSGLIAFFIIRDLRSEGAIRAKKYPWLFKFFVLLLIVFWGTIFYGSFIEPRLIRIVRKEIRLSEEKSLSRPIKIVLLSDTHVGPYKKTAFIGRIVSKIKSENPDLVLLAGDTILGDASGLIHLAPLKDLAEQYPVYAVLGNHDTGFGGSRDDFTYLPNRAREVEQYLLSLGADVLTNENRLINNNNSSFWLVGLDSYIARRSDIKTALLGTEDNFPKILFAHSPDVVYDAMRAGVDVVFAAHTHGGQVRLPLLGSIPAIPTELGQGFGRGLFSFGNTQLYITSGIGEAGARARLFNPPEIVILKLQ